MIELKKTPDGIIIPVRAQPGAKKDIIVGEWGGRLKIQIKVPPEKGKANEAIIKLLAKDLDLKRSKIRIISGESSRDKKVLVQDVTLLEKLENLCQR